MIHMRDEKDVTVEEIVGKLDAQRRGITEKLRNLVKQTLPDAEEKVKWGNITYLRKSKNLAWIIVYEGHVDFGFFRGAELASQRLEGTGKGLRHIKICRIEDIDEAEIARLLRDAANLDDSAQ